MKNHTKFMILGQMHQSNMLKSEDNSQLVLNDVHRATNNSGSYAGSKFMDDKMNMGIIPRLKSLKNIYINQ